MDRKEILECLLKLRLQRASVINILIELDEYIYIFEVEAKKNAASEEIIFDALE